MTAESVEYLRVSRYYLVLLALGSAAAGWSLMRASATALGTSWSRTDYDLAAGLVTLLAILTMTGALVMLATAMIASARLATGGILARISEDGVQYSKLFGMRFVQWHDIDTPYAIVAGGGRTDRSVIVLNAHTKINVAFAAGGERQVSAFVAAIQARSKTADSTTPES